MRGINKVVLVGRLGRDPEVRTGKSGVPWCTFTMATNRARRENDGWVEEADWHDVKVFGDDAERCQRMLRKGSVVGIDGALTYDAWTDENGQKRRKARIAARQVHFVTDLRSQAVDEPEATTEASDPGADPMETGAVF